LQNKNIFMENNEKKPIMNDNQWTIGMRRYYGYKKINKYSKKD